MYKILIVEDVELNVELLVQLLEDDFELVIANDGKMGVELAEAKQPDLILMDISLPIMDGYEATRRIKSNPLLSHIPIIAVTANAMSTDRDAAHTAGCDDFMTKPIDDDMLFNKLDYYLGD